MRRPFLYLVVGVACFAAGHSVGELSGRERWVGLRAKWQQHIATAKGLMDNAQEKIDQANKLIDEARELRLYWEQACEKIDQLYQGEYERNGWSDGRPLA